MNPPDLASDQHHLDRIRINFSWILKLRWAAAAGQLATILLVDLWLEIPLPLEPLCVVLGMEALTNIILTGWFNGVAGRTQGRLQSIRIGRVLGSIMLFDLLLLTLLLFLTGGPSNPFCIFFLVNIVLSAVVLNARWTWGLSALALLCLSTLFFAHLPLEPLEQMDYLPAEPGREHLFAGRMSVYLKGLAVAFIVAAVVIAVFITRLSKALAELESELAATRLARARSERLEALGTLTAGAAHELASPLSTIAVASRDLEIALAREDPGGEPAEDARLIRQEVTRCREILDLMASDAGQSKGEPLVPTSMDELLEQALSNLKRRDRVVVEVDAACRDERLVIPRRALALALRQIVKNALDATDATGATDGTGASGSRGPIQVRVAREANEIRFAVIDRGTGMTPETLSKAAEPFFTTKQPGQGMGLGLFLSQTVVDRLEGRIEFESAQNRGTTVLVTLPCDPLKRADDS